MMRGTFANVRIRNLMLPPGDDGSRVEGGFTLFQRPARTCDLRRRHEVHRRRHAHDDPRRRGIRHRLQRDWAAKGTQLLGVKAVVARASSASTAPTWSAWACCRCSSRAATARRLHLRGDEVLRRLGGWTGNWHQPQQDVTLTRIRRSDGELLEPRLSRLPLLLRIDTPVEAPTTTARRHPALRAAEAGALGGIEAMLDWYGYEKEEYRDHWRKTLREDFHIRPRRATGGFAPGEVIDLGSCTAEVIHAPGHTPGFAAFFFREPQVLFMGDYDLTAFGPWYGDRAGSIDETIASVRRLQQVPAKVWLTSHEDGCFEGDVAPVFDRYLAVIDEREAKLLDLLAEPRTMDEIVAACIVYRKPREPKAFFEWGEGAIMGKHLQRLLARGAIALEGGRYRRL
jgi:glyoxylase-like metal-dependent hydrolase (beta-lactamase superfamily II)